MDVNATACLNGSLQDGNQDARCMHLRILTGKDESEVRYECAKGATVITSLHAQFTCKLKKLRKE